MRASFCAIWPLSKTIEITTAPSTYGAYLNFVTARSRSSNSEARVRLKMVNEVQPCLSKLSWINRREAVKIPRCNLLRARVESARLSLAYECEGASRNQCKARMNCCRGAFKIGLDGAPAAN